MEALKAAMMPDTESNLGLNEAYRQGLEDMVEWMGRDDGSPLTNDGLVVEEDEQVMDTDL